MIQKKYTAFAISTITSGLLHFLIVSMMHRENFIELWFFTTFGLIQLFLGAQSLSGEKKSRFFLLALLLNGLFVVLWLLTRIFNAPFAYYSEAITWFDLLILLPQLLSFWFAVKILKEHKVTTGKILVIGLICVGLGSAQYGVAKASQNIFKGIPMSESSHKHSMKSMFVAPATPSPETVMIMGMEMTPEQAREHCQMMGDMTECQEYLEVPSKEIINEVVMPKMHDNSDGHHN